MNAPLFLLVWMLTAGVVVFSSVAQAQVGDRPQDLSYDTAVLEGLDKITARTFTLVAPVGQSVYHGRLDVIVRACRKHHPDEDPETAAFLDVWERKPNQPTIELFRGWMFASSPGVSAMEHPVYDLWVLDCINAEEEGHAATSATSAAASAKLTPKPKAKPIPDLIMTDD